MKKSVFSVTNTIRNIYKEDEQEIQPLLPSGEQVDDNLKLEREVDETEIKPLLPYSFDREVEDKKGGGE